MRRRHYLSKASEWEGQPSSVLGLVPVRYCFLCLLVKEEILFLCLSPDVEIAQSHWEGQWRGRRVVRLIDIGPLYTLNCWQTKSSLHATSRKRSHDGPRAVRKSKRVRSSAGPALEDATRLQCCGGSSVSPNRRPLFLSLPILNILFIIVNTQHHVCINNLSAPTK